MPIITTAEVNTLMQLSGYDTEIAAMIPIVQDFVVKYCKNRFLNGRVYVQGSGIAFVDGGESADTITDSDSQFVTGYFYAGMDIYVNNSYNNDGIKAVATVAAGTLTLAAAEALVAEDTGERIIDIICVKFPEDIKMTVANMILWKLQKKGVKGLKSFSLGDYSETFAELGEGGYPKELLEGLTQYRMTRLR